jgi:hypothetical protein
VHDRIPPLSRHANRFVERNLFLHALLGVISYGHRFSSAMDRLAPQVQRTSVRFEKTDRETLLVLGLISSWRRIERELSSWGADAAVERAPRGIARRLARGLRARAPRSVLR